MIEQFTKKPVTIEALQYTGLNFQEIIEFCSPEVAQLTNGFLTLQTLESDPQAGTRHNVSSGDYVIKGVKGEFYACKPDIFEQTYLSKDAIRKLMVAHVPISLQIVELVTKINEAFLNADNAVPVELNTQPLDDSKKVIVKFYGNDIFNSDDNEWDPEDESLENYLWRKIGDVCEEVVEMYVSTVLPRIGAETSSSVEDIQNKRIEDLQQQLNERIETEHKLRAKLDGMEFVIGDNELEIKKLKYVLSKHQNMVFDLGMNINEQLGRAMKFSPNPDDN